jgi:hypothetical protein
MAQQQKQNYSTGEAAEYIRTVYQMPCSISLLNKLATMGGGPNFCKVSMYRSYSAKDLNVWARGRITKRVSRSAELKQQKAA